MRTEYTSQVRIEVRGEAITDTYRIIHDPFIDRIIRNRTNRKDLFLSILQFILDRTIAVGDTCSYGKLRSNLYLRTYTDRIHWLEIIRYILVSIHVTATIRLIHTHILIIHQLVINAYQSGRTQDSGGTKDPFIRRTEFIVIISIIRSSRIQFTLLHLPFIHKGQIRTGLTIITICHLIPRRWIISYT